MAHIRQAASRTSTALDDTGICPQCGQDVVGMATGAASTRVGSERPIQVAATPLADAVRELECLRALSFKEMRRISREKGAITPGRGPDDANQKDAGLPELSIETHVAAGQPLL